MKRSDSDITDDKMEPTWAWPLGRTLRTYCFRASILSSSLCFSRALIQSSNRSQESSFSGILLRKSWRLKKGVRFGLLCCIMFWRLHLHPVRSISGNLCSSYHRLLPLPSCICLVWGRALSLELPLSKVLTMGTVRSSSEG